MTLRRIKTNKKLKLCWITYWTEKKKEAKRTEMKRYRQEKRISLQFLVFWLGCSVSGKGSASVKLRLYIYFPLNNLRSNSAQLFLFGLLTDRLRIPSRLSIWLIFLHAIKAWRWEFAVDWRNVEISERNSHRQQNNTLLFFLLQLFNHCDLMAIYRWVAKSNISFSFWPFSLAFLLRRTRGVFCPKRTSVLHLVMC